MCLKADAIPGKMLTVSLFGHRAVGEDTSKHARENFWLQGDPYKAFGGSL